MAKSIKNGAKKPQSPSDSPELRKNVDELMQKYGERVLNGVDDKQEVKSEQRG